MTREDLTSPVAAAATAQVKLCPYDEEEPHIGSASSRPSLQWQESNHKSSNMPMPLPACPSKSFGTYYVTLDVCNDSDEPFDFLTNTFAQAVWKEQVAILL